MSVKRVGDLAFLGNARAVVQLGSLGEGRSQQPAPGAADTKAEHTASVVTVNVLGSERQVQYAPWGSNNLFPDDIRKEAQKNGILAQAMRVRQKTHYGTGPFYFTIEARDDREVEKPIIESDPRLKEIMAFQRGCKLERYFQEAIFNHEWWGWTLPEFVLSSDFSTITSVQCLKTPFGRWSLTNEDGRSEWLVFNPNWAKYNTAFVKVVPVADPWWTPEEVKEWARSNGFHKFVRPTMIPFSGVDEVFGGYYPTMEWYAVYWNKWLQNTNAIPAFKDAAMRHQWSIKYHIKIPGDYFEKKFKDIWANLDDAQRLAKENETLQQMDAWLSGTDNAHKAFLSRFAIDDMGKPLPGWEIIPLEDKTREGVLIPDAEKGNSEILATTGVDPSLLGQGAPGGKLGAGSGSDKFEAIRILHALMYADQDMTLESWHFVRDFNGWDASIYIGFRPLDVSSMPEPGPLRPPATSPADGGGSNTAAS